MAMRTMNSALTEFALLDAAPTEAVPVLDLPALRHPVPPGQGGR
jgi:hypothetical protein